ncbi:unnamed protein product [Protopolystoma xenopodis]|uniref:DNA-directed RNA polymerase I subunit RPA2 domain-containing protein n=1 Tax=Protopolystoma xenopodis TaxID=117903 RepID=A0A448WXM0_9PLAT|nr:unnamed protein product [Protopolystoma xenopodis]
MDLRLMKTDPNEKRVPSNLEIIYVAPTEAASQFPGLFLFVGSSRLLRPVYLLVSEMAASPSDTNLGADGFFRRLEWLSTFEQAYLHVAVTEAEVALQPIDQRSHLEIAPEAIFSFVAGLTPYPDFNQVLL